MSLERVKVSGSAWNTVEEDSNGGGGGSQPTDTIIAFEQTTGDAPLFPITGLDVGAGTITVAGDQTRFFLRPETAGNAVEITGSTLNDGFYTLDSDATYDGGLDETTINIGANTLPDATVDGSAKPFPLYEASLVLLDNSSLEWVLAVTDVQWDVDDALLWVGDENDPRAFSNGISIYQGPDRTWQWPLVTLDAAGSAALLVGSNSHITNYPVGATIRVAIQPQLETGTSGRTRVIVHHHLTEPGATPVKTT